MTQCGIEPCAAMPKAGSHTVWISPILILIFCQMSHLQVRSCRGVHQAGENPELPVPRRKRQETKSAPAAAPAAARFLYLLPTASHCSSRIFYSTSCTIVLCLLCSVVRTRLWSLISRAEIKFLQMISSGIGCLTFFYFFSFNFLLF